MTRTLWPADAVAGAPSYSGRKLRQALGVLLGGATSARPLGGRTGVRPGTGALGTATSTTWTVSPHAGCLDLESSASAGPYLYSIDDSSNTGTVTAADATNPRIDLVYLTLNDPAESDGSSTPDVVPGYVAGVAAATPVAPATPARSMPLFTISVPKVGSGSPTVTNAAPYMAAAGAPIPVNTLAERNALTGFEGLRALRLDNNSTIDVYTGGAWVLGDTGWQPLTIASGYGSVTGYTLQYRVLNGVEVFVRGAVSYTSGGTITTLPAGARPSQNSWLGAGISSNGNFSYMPLVSPSGTVTIPATYYSGTATSGQALPISGSFLLG